MRIMIDFLSEEQRDSDNSQMHSICIDDDVIGFVERRGCNFRISTSCGGPVMLPLSYKPAKPDDIAVSAGAHTIYVSVYQARYLDRIHLGLIPFNVGQYPDEPY